MDIKGKFVTLRAQRREDQKLVCDIFNDPYIESRVVGWAYPLSYDHQENYFATHMSDPLNLRLIIETEEYGAVGVVMITDIDWKNRKAGYGIKLASSEVRSKGIGTDAMMAMLRYVFDELGLHKLESDLLAENAPSKAVFMKCGWKEEGLRPESIYKNGTWHDLLLVGIREADYRELIAANRYWDN